MEIVTWVLSGTLVHQDSEGHNGAIYPNLAQRMSAGTGIWHSEKNDGRGATEPVDLVQMWVIPDEAGVTPGYQQLNLSPHELDGKLAVVASGIPKHRNDAAIRIRNRFAALHVGRLEPGQSVTVPDAAYAHVDLARGRARLEGADTPRSRRCGTPRRRRPPQAPSDPPHRSAHLGDAHLAVTHQATWRHPSWPSAQVAKM